MPITGVVGQIKWFYYTAGTLNGYRVDRTGPTTWRLDGQIVIADAFKIAQRPLTFVAPHEFGEWRWPIVLMEIVQDRYVSAQLGPLEG